MVESWSWLDKKRITSGVLYLLLMAGRSYSCVCARRLSFIPWIDRSLEHVQEFHREKFDVLQIICRGGKNVSTIS